MKQKVSVKVTDFIPEFVQILKNTHGDKLFSHTMGAIKQISLMYQMIWRKYAAGEMTVPGKPPIHSKGDYTRSINIDDSQSNIITIYTDFPYHKYIESGHGIIDLKHGLLRGPKAKMGKNGPYNIVAYRHGVPGSDKQSSPMPLQIFQLMKGISDKADEDKALGLTSKGGTSKVTAVHVMEKSGKWKEYRSYKWGASISQKEETGKRSKLLTGYTWKSGKYAGMYKMNVSTSKAKRSNYITFRIVSVNSAPSSWIVPERPPIPIRQATVDFVKPFAEDMIKEALNRDLA